jgi:ankyrin repeat protein
MAKTRSSAEAFVAAVSNGDFKEAARLLSTGIGINAKVDGMSPLHYVARIRSLDGFRWLLEKGAAIDEVDDNGLTPLMVACNVAEKKANQIALELIEAGCDVTVRRHADGMSALEFAAKSAGPSVIRALVKKGAALNGGNTSKVFPALMAVRAGNLATLKALVDLGCDLTRKIQLPWAKGMTILGVAKLERRTAIVKYLESIDTP